MKLLDIIVRIFMYGFLAVFFVLILPKMVKDFKLMYRECFPKRSVNSGKSNITYHNNKIKNRSVV